MAIKVHSTVRYHWTSHLTTVAMNFVSFTTGPQARMKSLLTKT